MFMSGSHIVTIVAAVICEQRYKMNVEQKEFIMDKIGLREHWSFGRVNERNRSRMELVIFVPIKY
jgi:hypothetical protein